MERGQVIVGKYRLNQVLGTGGMAEVWSATNTFTERQLAIKFMNREVAKTPEAATRFLKEAKVSARINHPNIIDVIDVGQTEEGQLFLVMELLTGFPLETALRRQNPPMSIYELALVMVEVGDALAAAHKSGIVHRDLKPTNIFLHKVREGVAVPKLLDFGVSKFLEDDNTNHALTVAGTVLGSPLYMSPEQARGETTLDGRTDIFAFGAILFEALTGYRAYEAKNFNALIVKIATTKPKAIDACAPHVPDALRRVVRACMEPDLKRRAQTFEEVVGMLRQAMPELEASGMRLPASIVPSAVIDPDATNALPVMRASDRPRPMFNDTIPGMPGPLDALQQQQSSSGSIPPGAIAYPAQQNLPQVAPLSTNTNPSGPSGSSWTPNTSYASISTVSTPSAKRNAAWLAAAGAALVIGGIGIGAVVSSSRNPTSSRPSQQQDNTSSPVIELPVTPTTGAVTTTSAEEGTPTISVDALPGAGGANATGTVTTPTTTGNTKAVGAVPKGSGRLLIAASPGWCTITIDGKERGATPLAGIDLPAGKHQVSCKAPHGKERTASVAVQEGATSKYRFALDD